MLTLGIYLSNQEQCEDTKGQSESVNRKGTDNTRSKSQMPFQTKKKREKKRIIYLLMTDSWMFPHYCNMTIYIMDMTLPWRLIKLYVHALVAIKCPFRSIMNFQDYYECFPYEWTIASDLLCEVGDKSPPSYYRQVALLSCANVWKGRFSSTSITIYKSTIHCLNLSQRSYRSLC